LTYISIVRMGCTPTKAMHLIMTKKDAEFYFNSANQLARQGDYQKAIQDYNKAIEIDENYALAYCNRGFAKTAIRQCDAAINDCTKALEIDPTLIDALSNRACAKSAQGKYIEAIGDFTKALEINPECENDLCNMGLTNYALRQYIYAVEDFTKVLTINPQSSIALHSRGRAKYELKQCNQAIEDYTKALEINPGFTTALHDRAIAKIALEQYEQAINDYSKAIQLNENDALAYDKRGQIKYYLKQYDEAIADLTKAIEINPTYYVAFYVRGLVKYTLRKYAEAINDFTKALAIKPKFLLASKELANTKATLNATILRQNKEAIENYNEAIKLCESNPALFKDAELAKLYNDRGLSKFALSQVQEAIDDYDRAIKLDANFALAYMNRAAAKGVTLDALADLDESIKRSKDPKAFHNRANIRYVLGDKVGSEIDRDTTSMIIAGDLNNSGDLVKALEQYYRLFDNFKKNHHYCSDRIFYSFRNNSEFSKQELVLKYISFTSPKDFNDPFDSPIVWDTETTDKTNFFKSIHVRCFCHVSTQGEDDYEELKKILLWSHYANEHKGFAIGYRFNKAFFVKNIRSLMGKIDYTESVKYFGEVLPLETGLLTKQKDWTYESEYRLINITDESEEGVRSKLYYNDDVEIASITFGFRSSPEQRQYLCTVLSGNGYSNIKFYIMTNNASTNRYELTRRALDPTIDFIEIPAKQKTMETVDL
jgi:tetratricopeptide (TPR) repeat protein